MATLVYIVLFPFYMFVYAPTAPDVSLVPLITTGHIVPLGSGLFIPPEIMCRETVPVCTNWQADATSGGGGVPWVMDGQAGYCLDQVMTPTAACAERANVFASILLTFIIWVPYVMIGAGIEYLIKYCKVRAK